MEIRKTAELSDDGRYRYRLARSWGPGNSVGWIMLNPSTADASADDATIRRCMGFARFWGYDGIIVCNLFALRSTDPDKLFAPGALPSEIIGPTNDLFLAQLAAMVPRIICAWGNHGSLLQRDAHVVEVIRSLQFATLWHLGLTKQGQPKHPLRLRADTPLTALRIS